MKIPISSITDKTVKPGFDFRVNYYRFQGPPPNRANIAWQPTGPTGNHHIRKPLACCAWSSGMAQERSLRISQVGLRGIVGNGLTAAHVLDFASAFSTFLEPGGKIVVGRDPRTSSIMMREGVIAGLLAGGHDVIDLGIVSTPIIQHSIRRLDACGGISIGASHNAAEWNALKFFGPRGTYLSTSEAGELLDIYHLKKFKMAEWREIGKLHSDPDATERYLDELAQVFDIPSWPAIASWSAARTAPRPRS